MGEINGALYVTGHSAIYRIQLADEIDPKRTNIAVPSTYQKVLSYGTDFPYVRQTLMTARRLFRNDVLRSGVDCKTGIGLSFEALLDLVAIHDIRRDVGIRFDKIAEDLKDTVVVRRSMNVPSMGDVRGETQTFLQKADHVAIALFSIAKLFYGNGIGPSWFESLKKLAGERFGNDDNFTKVISTVLPFLQFVRNARNAVEHPDQTKSVKVTDITLLPNGVLNPPCVEVIHTKTPQPSMPVLGLMKHVADQLAATFEVILVCLCNANIHPVVGMPLGVIEYNEEQQKAFKCRYGYAARIGDQIVPLN